MKASPTERGELARGPVHRGRLLAEEGIDHQHVGLRGQHELRDRDEHQRTHGAHPLAGVVDLHGLLHLGRRVLRHQVHRHDERRRRGEELQQQGEGDAEPIDTGAHGEDRDAEDGGPQQLEWRLRLSDAPQSLQVARFDLEP